jgi:hypothetical protein
LSFLPFCAKAPAETISPIRAATKIDLKYFIYLTASSRLSGSHQGEAESLRSLGSATSVPNWQADARLTQIGGQGYILRD